MAEDEEAQRGLVQLRLLLENVYAAACACESRESLSALKALKEETLIKELCVAPLAIFRVSDRADNNSLIQFAAHRATGIDILRCVANRSAEAAAEAAAGTTTEAAAGSLQAVMDQKNRCNTQPLHHAGGNQFLDRPMYEFLCENSLPAMTAATAIEGGACAGWTFLHFAAQCYQTRCHEMRQRDAFEEVIQLVVSDHGTQLLDAEANDGHTPRGFLAAHVTGQDLLQRLLDKGHVDHVPLSAAAPAPAIIATPATVAVTTMTATAVPMHAVPDLDTLTERDQTLVRELAQWLLHNVGGVREHSAAAYARALLTANITTPARMVRAVAADSHCLDAILHDEHDRHDILAFLLSQQPRVEG